MVYVDHMVKTLTNSKWRFKTVCHLYADNIDELHAMAATIGLRRSWFQDHPLMPHYDLTTSKRFSAMKNGAESRTRIELVEHLRALRRDRGRDG